MWRLFVSGKGFSVSWRVIWSSNRHGCTFTEIDHVWHFFLRQCRIPLFVSGLKALVAKNNSKDLKVSESTSHVSHLWSRFRTWPGLWGASAWWRCGSCPSSASILTSSSARTACPAASDGSCCLKQRDRTSTWKFIHERAVWQVTTRGHHFTLNHTIWTGHRNILLCYQKERKKSFDSQG